MKEILWCPNSRGLATGCSSASFSLTLSASTSISIFAPPLSVGTPLFHTFRYTPPSCLTTRDFQDADTHPRPNSAGLSIQKWRKSTSTVDFEAEKAKVRLTQARPERDSDSSKEGSKDTVSKAAALGPSSLKSKIISVAVGGQTEPFLIHQNILCASSPFFRNACNGGWKESEEGFVTIPYHSPEAFEVYVQWLYFGNMFVEDQKDDYENMDWDIFIDAYLLGDKLLDVDFRNALIDLAIRVEVHFDQIPHNHAKAAYSGLPESDPYCRLYVDMHTWEIASSWYSDVNNKDAKDAPMEFFRDVAKTAAENRKSIGSSEDGPWVTDPGRYHHKHPSS